MKGFIHPRARLWPYGVGRRDAAGCPMPFTDEANGSGPVSSCYERYLPPSSGFTWTPVEAVYTGGFLEYRFVPGPLYQSMSTRYNIPGAAAPTRVTQRAKPSRTGEVLFGPTLDTGNPNQFWSAYWRRVYPDFVGIRLEDAFTLVTVPLVTPFPTSSPLPRQLILEVDETNVRAIGPGGEIATFPNAYGGALPTRAYPGAVGISGGGFTDDTYYLDYFSVEHF
jgi:hypothetical protein